jgi:hypothetical protein
MIYERPLITISKFENNDIVTASGDGNTTCNTTSIDSLLDSHGSSVSHVDKVTYSDLFE